MALDSYSEFEPEFGRSAATGVAAELDDLSSMPKILKSTAATSGAKRVSDYSALPSSAERRAHHRYPASSELEFTLERRGRIAVHGRGKAIDISSGGLLFESDGPLPVGFPIELVLAWPARFNHSQTVELVISGQIVRSDGCQTAVSIARHEFRRKNTPSSTTGEPVPSREERPVG